MSPEPEASTSPDAVKEREPDAFGNMLSADARSEREAVCAWLQDLIDNAHTSAAGASLSRLETARARYEAALLIAVLEPIMRGDHVKVKP